MSECVRERKRERERERERERKRERERERGNDLMHKKTRVFSRERHNQLAYSFVGLFKRPTKETQLKQTDINQKRDGEQHYQLAYTLFPRRVFHRSLLWVSFLIDRSLFKKKTHKRDLSI